VAAEVATPLLADQKISPPCVVSLVATTVNVSPVPDATVPVPVPNEPLITAVVPVELTMQGVAADEVHATSGLEITTLSVAQSAVPKVLLRIIE
jgi:hypothetical protein